MRLLALLLIPLILAGCATTPAIDSDGDTISVSASFYPLAFVAERIGGEYATVTTVTPAGAEPHDYEPTARQIADLQSADVFVWNGGGVDPWAERIEPELEEKGVTLVEAIHDLTLLPGGEDEHADEEATETAADGHEHGNVDPHVWLDPVLMSAIAIRIEEALIAADPAHAATYTANAAQLRADLTALDEEFKTKLTTCDIRQIIVSHDAFRYLGARYGVETLAIAGLDPSAEPSPARLAELSTYARAHDIRHIFFEALVSPRLSETIAREVGADTLALSPIESVGPGEDYFSAMRADLAGLQTAMRCR